MSAETAWQAGRLGKGSGSRRLLFGAMHEDVEIERHAFRNRGRIFCIASAGNAAMALSTDHEVLACDINPVQLAYARGRVEGAPRQLGDAERAMKYARALAPAAGWRKRNLRDFLALSSCAEQLAFWTKHLDTWRFRTGMDVLMSPLLLRLVYSPRLLACLPNRFGAVLRSRLERGFANHSNAANPYARALLLGEYQNQPEKVNASNIRFALGDAASCLDKCPAGSFDGFTLSNILDGAESAYRERLWRAVKRAATSDAIVIARSFGEPTSETVTNFAARDRSMLWGVVEIRSANVGTRLPDRLR